MNSAIRAAAFSFLLAWLALAAPAAVAQPAYPAKPIRIVVGFAPGGGNDVLARLLATRFQEAWGQPAVVDNKPGANGIIATEFVAKSPGDGYTLLMSSSGGMTVNPLLYTKLPYEPLRDFAPISVMGLFPLVLAVHPSVPASSVGDLVAHAKAHPGKLNYGSPSAPFQLATELFKQMAGIDATHVPYKGSGPAVAALLAGDVQMIIVDSPALLPLIKAGKARALAVTSARRVSLLPELPTIAEAGFPGYEMVLWVGLFAPAGTPREILSKLEAEVIRASQAPEIRQRMSALGVEPAGSTAEQTATRIRDETARYRAVARAAGMKPE